ncbi:hypothetical protein [Nocardioides sp. cx-173]|uniref:hypothetical protein n=1 Tax=Nocardioides sp. cx-173 TaxID=2898796 RepID=UPI001E577C4D|nr:hypothetical protein [Nocardioides sp. cx-173]MCD4524437.1 hypothetical protein [Nocardioides sp. cx-173]UGB43077.1 hypothetical protein LQ940_06010 [Nocardioides sp. cx-173]
MRKPAFGRPGLLAAALTLVAGTAVSCGSPESEPESPPAGDSSGPTAADTAVAWLSEHMTDGLLDGACPDYCGRNIDAALALEAAGADPAVLDEMEKGFEPVVAGYISYSYPDEKGGEVTGDVGGAAAKSAVFAQLVDAAPGYGGVDLIARVADHVSDEPGLEGRLFDRTNGKVDYQYANTLGQAFAAHALDAADHPEAEAATQWLVQQQCEEGFFRESFSPASSPDQGCDSDPAAAGSVDTTATALLMLHDQADDAEIEAVLSAGAAWLAEVQNADGSWGTQPGEPGNANSTGVAGQALGELGDREAVQQAARWVGGVQVDDSGSQPQGLAGEAGAIAFDRGAYDAARSKGIGAEGLTQWQYATAQGLGALAFASDTDDGATSP